MELPERLYYVDWIRVFAFSILIFFHCAMPFVVFDWEVKNQVTSMGLSRFIWWMHQWRLPLLFLISGVGVNFSLRRRSVFRFFLERLTRLFIPLLFAMFFTIPLQVFIEKTQKGYYHGSYIDFYPSVWSLVPYPEGTLTWSHMWFVVYLFVYCLLLLPVFGLFKWKSLQNIRQRVSGFFSHPVLILFPALVLMCLYFTLYLSYPEHQSLLDDWFLFLFSMTLFFYGFCFGGQPRFWMVCEKYRKYYLVTAILCAMALLYDYWWDLEMPKAPGNRLYFYGILNSIHIWCIILSILGFSKKYLNFSSPRLKYANEAVYPFYIIHQTLIVVIGYFVVQWHLSLTLKLILLTILSLLAMMITYHFFIKRFVLTRFLFGMKTRSKRKSFMLPREESGTDFGEPMAAG